MRAMRRTVGHISFVAFVLISVVLIAAAPSPRARINLNQETSAVFDQPLLITSVGQSPEVQLAVILARRAAIEHTLSKMATVDDLSDFKSLALVIGASMKGLGAAGIDTAKEKARVDALLAAAKEQGIPVLCLHLGGEQRRGELTDELIRTYLPLATTALIVETGNKDGLFTNICGEKNIPLIEVAKTADAVEPLKTIFEPKN